MGHRGALDFRRGTNIPPLTLPPPPQKKKKKKKNHHLKKKNPHLPAEQADKQTQQFTARHKNSQNFMHF